MMPIPSDLPKIYRTSAKSQVLTLLQDWITEGILQPGEKIVDTELAKMIGVSRTPIREALQILETQGFVEMKPGKETRITYLKQSDAYNIYLPLTSLEVLATQLATNLITSKQIHALEQLNQKFADAILSKDSRKTLQIDREFHQLIIDTANNPYICSFTHTLHLHAKRFEILYFEHSQEMLQESVQEHQAIIEAFRTRDVDKAKKNMEKNWLRALEAISTNLKVHKNPLSESPDSSK